MMSAMQKIKVECHRKEMSDASDLQSKKDSLNRLGQIEVVVQNNRINLNIGRSRTNIFQPEGTPGIIILKQKGIWPEKDK